MRISNAVRHIEHIATLPLTPHIVIPEMLRALDSVVPNAAPGFFWVDRGGAITDAYLPSAHADHVGSIGREIADRCQVWRRAGAGPSLQHCDDGAFHMTLSVRGELRAVLAIERGSRVTSFTERERRIVTSLAPCFSRALDASQISTQAFDEMPDRVGVIVARADGRVLSADPDAMLLLLEMNDRPLVPDTACPGADRQLPSFLLDLLRRGSGSAPVQKVARWGVYRARCFAQNALVDTAASAAPTTAIMLSRHLPRIVRLMRTIETCDLSPRERQATFQLGIGADSAAAAAALGVSLTTWRSYVKRVYQRLDVRDRIELMSFLSAAALE